MTTGKRNKDQYDQPKYFECDICEMGVRADVKVCPYCGARHYTQKEWDAKRHNVVFFAIVCFIQAAMAFYH